MATYASPIKKSIMANFLSRGTICTCAATKIGTSVGKDEGRLRKKPGARPGWPRRLIGCRAQRALEIWI